MGLRLRRRNRILTGEQIRMKFAHLSAAANARREGRPLPWDDPALQKRIRDAKQAVADAAARQLRFGDDDDRP